MLLEFKQYYRLIGIRRLQSLASPTLMVLKDLPRGSILHWLTHHPESKDVDTSLSYLGDYVKKKINLTVVTDMHRNEGVSMTQKVIPRNLVSEWVREHRNFRYSLELDKDLSDHTQLTIINYNYANEIRRYLPNIMESFNRYLNPADAMWREVARLASSKDRINIVPIELPHVPMKFRVLEQLLLNKEGPLHRNELNTPERHNLYQLWLWLNPETRSRSVFAHVDVKDYPKVQLLVKALDGRYVVLSMAYLNSWMRGQPNMTEFHSVQAVEPLNLRRMVYNLYLALMQPGATIETQEASPDTIIDETRTEEDIVADAGDKSVDKSKDPLEGDKPTALAQATDTAQAENLDKIIGEVSENIEFADNLIEPIADIDEEEVDNFDTVVAELQQPLSIEDILTKKLESYSVTGRLSAAQYKQIKTEIAASQASPEPYGSGKTRAEFGNVQASDIALSEERIDLAVNKLRVPDASMHKSTLKSLDSDYISKVLPRDVVRMVSNLQRAGIIVRSHTVEHKSDIQGESEVHTLDIKPIDGQPSRLRFRIPKIEKDGTYVSGGNKYVMRRQRYDRPIRKIGPSTVQFSSYYGKTQVTLSDKSVDSSSRWLLSKLRAYAMGEESIVTAVVPGEAYSHDFKAPSVYSTISEGFLSFKVRRNTFVFDHRQRKELATKFQWDLTKLEQKGSVVVGYSDYKEPIIITARNEFVIKRSDGDVPLGDVYRLLQLDTAKAPLDIAQIRIGRQQVPIGLMLGYFMGLRNLLKLIKAKYRVVPAGKRASPEQDEYQVKFSDCTYVFDRRDPITSMLMAGFVKYDKAVRQYSVKDYNKSSVYLNIMQDAGMGPVVIRDMGLMDELFVDPITMSVLQERNEPTTFQGLALFACELLTHRHHPASQDTDAQRLRGSERIAGAIYTEMVKSIKQYKSRRSGKVEMSPWAVWTNIQGDQSGKITEDINPIQQLKEQEIVTYVGEGGRDKSSMVSDARAFHVSDIGLMSEAGVDSGDVGVTAYLAANPKLTTMYGSIDSAREIDPSKLLSTSGLLAQFGDKDDMLNMSICLVTSKMNFL